MDNLFQQQATEVAESLLELVPRFSTTDAEGLVAYLPAAQFELCSMPDSDRRSVSLLNRELNVSWIAVKKRLVRLERVGPVEWVMRQAEELGIT